MFQRAFAVPVAVVAVLLTAFPSSSAFGLSRSMIRPSSSLFMALDTAMEKRLESIRRSYKALTERLGDPDVLEDSNLLRQVMSDRSQSEDAVLAYEEYLDNKEQLEGAKELFQEAGGDPEMREMARAEMREIEANMEDLEKRITVLLLPKDPNDNRNVMLEIRAGTGGSEANIFAGTRAIMYVDAAFLIIELTIDQLYC
jgi:peptide chain release factor 1